jgi:hypothetical protein
MDIHGYRLNIGDIVCHPAPTLEAAYALALRETETLVKQGFVVAARNSKRWRAAKDCQHAMDVRIQAVTTCQCCGGDVYADWQPDPKREGYWLITCQNSCKLHGFTFSSPTYPMPPERYAQYVGAAR